MPTTITAKKALSSTTKFLSTQNRIIIPLLIKPIT